MFQSQPEDKYVYQPELNITLASTLHYKILKETMLYFLLFLSFPEFIAQPAKNTAANNNSSLKFYHHFQMARPVMN